MKILRILLFFYTPFFAQTTYPTTYFKSPLLIPMQLSGNFGELRNNHFHSGLDYKTNQKEGLPVLAAADGYVSRIKISTFGYGKAIYINHPNGYTTVYGHLQKANGTIESYIKKSQYDQKSFEIEQFPLAKELPVKQGDTIAWSGNTGGSEGPHLHFEFRDTQTENIINPLFFGFDSLLKDTKKPFFSSLFAYPISTKSTVNQSKVPIILHVSLQKDGTFLAEDVRVNGSVGFGITGFDYDDVSYNANGIYKLQNFQNGQLTFGYQMDHFSFAETRFVNALVDYERYKKTKQRVQKLFQLNPLACSIVQSDSKLGVFTATPNLNQVCRIELSDFHANKTIIQVPISYANDSVVIPAPKVDANWLVKANQDTFFEQGPFSVFFPAKTFYDNFQLRMKVNKDTLHLHEDLVPAHSNFQLSYTDSLRKYPEKTFFGLVEKGSVSYSSTKFKKQVYSTYVKKLGTYVLVTDTVAPTIKMPKSIEGRWMSNEKQLKFTITDSGSGIKNYMGYLNSNWVLFEYDYKSDQLVHEFDPAFLLEGKNELKLIVTDHVGNSAIFETTFFRSQKTKP
ncbi:MAG: M23 family metallopeptidase [Flavobacterium sp.]|nr:M23 family metallopeptidase [Flavobacterium sp.]